MKFCIVLAKLLWILLLGGDEVDIVTHTYPHKFLRKIKVAICDHKVDRPFYLWPDVCSGDLQSSKKSTVWYITLNVLTKTKCDGATENCNGYCLLYRYTAEHIWVDSNGVCSEVQ